MDSGGGGEESFGDLGSTTTVVQEDEVETRRDDGQPGPEDGGPDESSTRPDYLEERFRVDRRKLEELLLQASKDETKNAEEFFTQIMQETNATVVWPSKLKIGAKSKKDPLIKVFGLKSAVLQAKERIMKALDTKSLRVTLKMEVSHTEHSHVIGKGGINVQRVMQETGCHIHFPDSNRSNLGEKSNQVSITGQLPAVETARTNIRMLLPLMILFELPVSSSLNGPLDCSSPIIKQTQQQYGVIVIVKQRLQPGSGYVQTIILRGSIRDKKSVEEASVALFEALTGRVGVPFTVTLLMDVTSVHLPTIIGCDGSNIKQIFRRTGATVYFPDTVSTLSPRSTLYITGGIQNVFNAREELMGLLPVVLMFDIKEEKEIKTGQIAQLMEQLDVFISLKPKAKQLIKSVVVKSIEHNISNVYETRRLLLNLVSESQLDVAMTHPSSGDPKLSTASKADQESNVPSSCCYHFSTYSSGVPINRGQLMSPAILSSYIPAPSSFQPVIILPSVPSYHVPASALPRGGHFIPVMRPPTNDGLISASNKSNNVDNSNPLAASPTSVAESHDFNSSNRFVASNPWQTSLQTDLQHFTKSKNLLPMQVPERELDNGRLQTQRVGSSLDGSIFLNSSDSNRKENSGNSCDNPKMIDTESLLRLCLPTSALCASSDNQLTHRYARERICSTQNLLKTSEFNNRQNLESFSSPQFKNVETEFDVNSKDGSSSSARRRFGQLPSPCGSDASLLNVHDPIHGGGHGIPFELRGANSPGSDPSKAPGRGRPKKSPCSSFPTASDIFADFDYEEIKLSATRAMQQKPAGDSRTPTDCWSGFYFSKSMPDSALCDKLNHNALRYKGSNTLALNEDTVVAETEGDSWKSLLHSYKSDLTESPLELFHCNDSSGSYSFGNTSNFSDVASAVANSVDFPMDQSSQLKNCSGGFDDTLSKLSQLWHPRAKERVTVEEPSDLAELFSKLGLGKYTDLFQQQEIDLATFLTLTESDLKELGISTFGARRKMLLAIADNNERRRSFIPPPPGLPNPFKDPKLPRGHDGGSQSGRW